MHKYSGGNFDRDGVDMAQGGIDDGSTHRLFEDTGRVIYDIYRT